MDAEDNLDKFWAALDRMFQGKCGRMPGGTIDLLMARLRKSPVQRATRGANPAALSTVSGKNKERKSTKAGAPPSHAAEEARVAVDARSLKAFRALLYNPAVTSSQGTLTWGDFLHAMTSSGLFVAQKMYGSMWHFTHVQDGTTVEFRQPASFEEKKMPFTTVMRYGRRLQGAFGYDDKTFTLK